MRQRAWTPLVCLAGAVTAGALLFDRAPSALGWAALPLVGWLVAVTLTRPAPLSATVQAVVVVVIAVAVTGEPGANRWDPSVWDGVIAYTFVAAIAWLGAFLGEEGLRWHRFRPPSGLWARAWVRRVVAAVAVLLVVCVGAYALLPLRPLPPPRDLVLPLPNGLHVIGESSLCFAGTDTCEWRLDIWVDESNRMSLLLPDGLGALGAIRAHLHGTKGWPEKLAAPSCRTWGWMLREQACLRVETQDRTRGPWTYITINVPGADLAVLGDLVPPGTMSRDDVLASLSNPVTVVVTYR